MKTRWDEIKKDKTKTFPLFEIEGYKRLNVHGAVDRREAMVSLLQLLDTIKDEHDTEEYGVIVHVVETPQHNLYISMLNGLTAEFPRCTTRQDVYKVVIDMIEVLLPDPNIRRSVGVSIDDLRSNPVE